MNQHSSYQRVRSHLAYLKLRSAAEQLAPALERAERDKPAYADFLDQLLGAEVSASEQRRLERRLRLAGFPHQKTLEQFDFSAQPNLDRKLIAELATLRFVEERSNVLLIGSPGVGKTMLAVALARKAVEAGARGYYTTAADLVARTSKSAAEGRWQNTMRFWAGPGVLVVDELGYLPLPGEAASALLPSRQPPLRTGLDHPHDQPRDRRVGRDLQGHDRRRGGPRPPPSSLHGGLDRGRELPHARAPRETQPASDGGLRRWGISVIVDRQFLLAHSRGPEELSHQSDRSQGVGQVGSSLDMLQVQTDTAFDWISRGAALAGIAALVIAFFSIPPHHRQKAY